MFNIDNARIASVAAGALAVVGLGFAAPALADSVRSDADALSTVIGVNAPTYEFEDFGVLHDRGQRVGIKGPGFEPVRPTIRRTAEGR
ncbi:hypothetical protein [Mycolicibacterium confluentis]|uniref:Uncharacterized protein n=1 Tax=Mycolicibacterium confluentis TaxID=28047 RepID=A0A7I7XUS9_9MYCO|nr:hypothetical protein [Mycolicibacterium confluentis]MCV7322183.1 hypothetical protein [Mycolicibacterium confluentis]ORV31499.1 hypothetical protein AWB99_11915 [Mycolicibacterium confluentis]BBZ32921.1 hypothetical protein MCNF_15260 [Mycolicibacterium confluentis]